MASEAAPERGPGTLIGAAVDLAVAAALPVFVVTTEGGRIVDVRVATRDFLLANLAGDALTQGGKACKKDVGDSPSRSA